MVPLAPLLQLLIALAAVGWSSWRANAEYAAFKKLVDTRARQARFRRWVLTGLALFGGGSLAILAILGDLGCVIHPPKPFFGAMRQTHASLSDIGPETLGGLVAALTVFVVGVTLFATIAVRRRAGAADGPTLGDIAPLAPRNWAETGWTALLSVNAGVTEELFFRLVLPLLIALVTGNAAAGFVAATIVFGLAHAYQGWVGVVATTILGAVFTGLYLWSGGLAVPIAVHAGIDLLSLVVRPTIRRLAAEGARNPPP